MFTSANNSAFQRALASAAVVAFAVVTLAACGKGSDGNTISGNLTYTTSAARATFLVATEPLTGYTVQLTDSTGAVVAETTVDADGNFKFTGVKEGDYTLVVKDDVGDVVTEVNVTILEGDDATINGAFTDTSVTWDVVFDSNDSGALNDTQMKRAQTIADLSGMSVDEVVAMRESGMGWGVIAKELGLHPGQLGMGHPDGWEPHKTTKANKGKGKGKPDNAGGGKPDNAGPKK